jgi:carboxyl-terminal processing protease
MFTRLLALALALTAATLVPAPARAQASCSATGQKTFVRDVMFEYYYWYRQLPQVNLMQYPTPEAYLEAVRYKPLDQTYSYIANRAEQEAFFSDSEFIGLGISTQFSGAEMRIAQVFPDSPASEAGVARGDRVVAIDGRSIGDLAALGQLGNAFGPATDGHAVEVSWQRADGSVSTAKLTKRAVKIPTVSETRLYEVGGRKVGYIFFRNFVQPSFDALDSAFTRLRDAGATELVLDLRYNGGGLVAVAQHLASLIGGANTTGKVFAEFFHNDKHGDLNRTLQFEDKPNTLNLSRLVVITTRASASASELVINALEPFVPVTIVGDTTFGKPVGQYSFPFCDKVLNPVSFTLRNAEGKADFFSGFPADCPAPDDLDRQLGDPGEASLSEAFTVLRTGSCSAQPADTARTLARQRPILPTDGWQQLLGAH